MSDQLSKIHWTERDLARVGVTIDPTFVNEALEEYWDTFAKGLAGHDKVHVNLGRETPPRTEGALIGFFNEFSGVKDIHRGPTNAVAGPVRSVDIFLRNRITGKLLLSLEGVSISNGRTGWFAAECIDLLLPGRRSIEVFLFGTGPVAEAAVLHLGARAHDRVKRISVLSNSTSNQCFVDKLQPMVRVTLEAVGDRRMLPNADFIITATNAHRALFAVDEIGPNGVSLALGINEYPEEYIEFLLKEGGLFVVDDMVAVEKRNVDTLALYYSRRGRKLSEEGKRDGVTNFADIHSDPALRERHWNRPAHVVPVGLASMDIAVAARVYKVLLAGRGPTTPHDSIASPRTTTSTPNRIGRLKASLEFRGIHVLICFKPEHIFYLTAFNPSICSSTVIAILTGRSDPVILVNTLDRKKAGLTPGRPVVYNYGKSFGAETMGDTWQDAIRYILLEEDQNIGIEEEISAFQLQRVLPGASFSYVSDLIWECRNVKDADEIASARIAGELCDAGMVAAEMSLISVSTEQHAVSAAWNAMYELWAMGHGNYNISGFGPLGGSDFYGFKPWVLAGRRRFLQVPSADPVCDDAVSVFLRATVNGMHAELGRTFCIGDVSTGQRDALARIEEIRAEVFAMLKPGVPLNKIYEAACARLVEHSHTLPSCIGYGTGLTAHEHLSIDQHTHVELAPGMILAIKPNIEIPDQNVATQLSDTVVITGTGYEFLASYGERAAPGRHVL